MGLRPFAGAEPGASTVLVMETANKIDARIANGVLVFGSLPPRGRDLDLLARAPERAIVAATLLEEGYLQREIHWVCFRGCDVSAVDLVPADSWHLPPQELAALFREAKPLDGWLHLLAPAPHHQLLIAARRQVREGGALTDRSRERLERALSSNPEAWSIAWERAPLWNARAAMSLLAKLDLGGDVGSGRARVRGLMELGTLAARSPESRARLSRRIVRRRSSGKVIVALSGLDGAGKSTLAQHLHETLARLSVESAVVWPPAQNLLFGMNPALKRRLRRLLERTGSSPPTVGDRRTEPEEWTDVERRADPEIQDAPEFPPLPRQGTAFAHVLAGIVALSQALALRRAMRGCPRSARVLIFDRYVLDAIVYLRHRWGDTRPLRWQCLAIRLLSPRPAAAYLLEIDPERALARKRDFPLQNLHERAVLYREHHQALGVKTIDAMRPVEDLCEEIAREVWLLLPT